MNQKKYNNYLYQMAYSIILLVFFIIRISAKESNLSTIYVGLINYIGAASAFLLTSRKMILAFPVTWHKWMVWLWLAIFVCALVYGAASFGMGIVYSTKESDCITIFALFFSIPCDTYYVAIKSLFGNNGDNKI